MGESVSFLIERYLLQQADVDSCVARNLETVLRVGGGTDWTWKRIAAKVYEFVGDPPDNWAPPENALRFLQPHFASVGFVQGQASGIEMAMAYLTLDRVLLVWYQDCLPDLRHPNGYPKNGRQGHCGFITGINPETGMLRLAEPSRLKSGNERLFYPGKVVLTEPFNYQPGLVEACLPVYQVPINYFVANWHDLQVLSSQKVYHQPLVWVDLASRR